MRTDGRSEEANRPERAPTRREFLRMAAAVGLFGTTAAACGGQRSSSAPASAAASAALPATGSASPASPPPGPAAVPRTDSGAVSVPAPDLSRLARGLAALSKPHPRTWVDGHAGAAVIASHYFVVDNALDERTTRALRANVDAFIARDPQEFPEADPGPGRADPAEIVEELHPHVHELRSGGHDAIFATLALRALRDLPEFATPSIVGGMRRLVAQHVGERRAVQPSQYALENPMPPFEDPEDVAVRTLRAMLRPWSHVRRAGASGVLHWVTHAEALVTLEELGHAETARRGYDALGTSIHRPVEEEGAPPPARPPRDWLGPDFWESDLPRRAFAGTWLGGHSFKLPHSVFRLLRRVDDPDLRRDALARAALLTAPFE